MEDVYKDLEVTRGSFARTWRLRGRAFARTWRVYGGCFQGLGGYTEGVPLQRLELLKPLLEELSESGKAVLRDGLLSRLPIAHRYSRDTKPSR